MCEELIFLINNNICELNVGFQTIAVTVKNCLLLDLGLSVSLPVILIPALTGLSSESNPNETVFITAGQASWLGNTNLLFNQLNIVIMK